MLGHPTFYLVRFSFSFLFTSPSRLPFLISLVLHLYSYFVLPPHFPFPSPYSFHCTPLICPPIHCFPLPDMSALSTPSPQHPKTLGGGKVIQSATNHNIATIQKVDG